MKKELILSIMAFLPILSNADESGSCGNNLTWTFKESTKTLTISGSGPMEDYTYDGWSDNYKTSAPWYGLNFQAVNIKSGVTSIGNAAFAGFNELSSVTIPNSVTSIGNRSFYDCIGLSSVTIPNSVTNIGRSAFAYCNNLTSVNITDLKAWCQIVFESGDSNPLCYAHHLFLNNQEIKHLEIPNEITSIKEYTFYYCEGLTSVTIPSSVTSIADQAFSGCSNLTSVNITDLSAWCQIDFEDNPLSEAHHLFLNNQEITNLIIPDGITTIKKETFRGCEGITAVTIPDGVTSLGTRAFDGCSGLTSITIPNSVTSIGNQAFFACSSLDLIISNIEEPFEIPSKLYSEVFPSSATICVPVGTSELYKKTAGWDVSKYIYEEFPERGLVGDFTYKYFQTAKEAIVIDVKNHKDKTTLEIPATVNIDGTDYKVISFDVDFSYSENLTSLTIGENVRDIYGFAACKNLEKLEINNGVIIIGNDCFRGCTSLKSVIIPESVTNIGWNAFWKCSALTSVEIHGDVDLIDSWAFNCEKLISFKVYREKPLEIETKEDDWYDPPRIEPKTDFFPSRGQAILYVPRNCSEAYKAAYYWKDFKAIKEFIEQESTTYAIEEGNTLSVGMVNQKDKEVEIPESVNVDGKDLPVKAIADNAFEGNTVIKKVSIPESVEEIGESAFAECVNLRAIYSKATEPIDLSSGKATVRTRADGEEVSASNVFTNVDKRKCILYVPMASIAKYKAAKGWGEFQHIVGIGDLLPGDANGSTEVEATDVDAVKDFILTDEEPEGFKYQNADANGDYEVNAADIVMILNIIKNK